MWVSSINIKNIRCFENEFLKLSKSINIIIGANNSGKTTFLKSFLMLQSNDRFKTEDFRKNTKNGNIVIKVEGDFSNYFKFQNEIESIQMLPGQDYINIRFINGKNAQHKALQVVEPYNYIYPFLSKRKTVNYDETININNTKLVSGNFKNLYSKIDRISNPTFLPAYNDYVEACDEILGFRIGCVASGNGKKAAYVIKNDDYITIDNMGEGIANILALIADLCISEDKLFLIEEPENDIHPKALKGLLRLITKKSENNQFVITTHSNIVTKYLGAQKNTKIFSVEMDFQNKIPTSTIVEIGDSQQERIDILESLGYELYDFDLWEGWLFLEESSAEKIIRDYIIPWFLPSLKGKLRTFSSCSISEVEPKFRDFNNLFVFIHLQQNYKNKAWVVIDSGVEEEKIISRMRSDYAKNGWHQNQFLQFNESDFERYYPERFRDEVNEILNISSKQEKRTRKRELLEKVIGWIEENHDHAKDEFFKSTGEIIEILGKIQAVLVSTK